VATEHHMSVLSKATSARLTASAEMWANRIERAPLMRGEESPIQYPYVVCVFVGGGNQIMPARLNKRYVDILWSIRAISDDLDEAYRAALRISELFANSDIRKANPLDSNYPNSSWEISSVTEGETIDTPQQIETEILYHVGSIFRVIMQEK